MQRLTFFAGSRPNTNGPGLGSNAVWTIQLDGTNAGPDRNGLVISAGNSTVQGLSITHFLGAGLVLMTHGSNFVKGNSVVGNSEGNIAVQSGDGNTIGGTDPGARNIATTIDLSSNNNKAQGNITNGIGVGGSFNTIGGPSPTDRNVISGNIKYGVELNGSNNLVLGNFIGTDVTGNLAVSNRRAGVFITGTSNTVGGTAPGAGNIIAGNGRGVYIFGGSNNVVQGNRIGINASGAVLGNGGEGVLITSNGANNLIGGTTAAARNVISGNRTGVTLFLGATGNLVQGNLIGTMPDGVTGAGNTFAGVYISSTAANNTIGGTAPGAGNTIAYTQGVTGTAGSGDGVFVESVDSSIAPPTGNAILGNSIFSNAGLGIDLTPDGVTSNDTGDADTGANNLQNFPVLSSAVRVTGGTTVNGTLNSKANQSFRIEFFTSPAADPSGFGEGKVFLGGVVVTTDSSGNASFTVTLAGVPAGSQVITATATDSGNNTSEFSRAISVTG